MKRSSFLIVEIIFLFVSAQQIVREKRSRFSFSSNDGGVDGVDIDGVAKTTKSSVDEKDLLLLYETLPSHDDSNLDTRL